MKRPAATAKRACSTSTAMIVSFHNKLRIGCTCTWDSSPQYHPQFTQLVFVACNIPIRLGNLWRCSTAKLEAQGARCNHVIRRQMSAHHRSADRGWHSAESLQAELTYNSKQNGQLLGVVTLRKKRSISLFCSGSRQLVTPEALASIVSPEHPFTGVAVLEATPLLTPRMPKLRPLFTFDKHVLNHLGKLRLLAAAANYSS
eukprot:6178459-Pleurochrysis_carterae.AAC.1